MGRGAKAEAQRGPRLPVPPPAGSSFPRLLLWASCWTAQPRETYQTPNTVSSSQRFALKTSTHLKVTEEPKEPWILWALAVIQSIHIVSRFLTRILLLNTKPEKVLKINLFKSNNNKSIRC